MSNEKSFSRGRPQSDDWEDESSGGTHYFHKANGFTINGGEFNNVRGNTNHYHNDLKGSTNYSGQSVNNTREFGTGAIFNGGDFTHAGGDSNYFGPSNNYSGQSSHYDYRGSRSYNSNYEEGMNNSQNLRNPTYQRSKANEPFLYNNRLRSGRDVRPSPRQDYYAQTYDDADEGRRDSGQSREDNYQRDNPLSYRERGKVYPQQMSRYSREDHYRRQNNVVQAPRYTNDFEPGASQNAEQITEALTKCLALDSHISKDQKSSKEQVLTMLQQYFETPDMDEYDAFVQALAHYQRVHKDTDQSQLRQQLFKALRQYLHRGQEHDRDGFFDAVSAWVRNQTTGEAEEEEADGGDYDEQGWN